METGNAFETDPLLDLFSESSLALEWARFIDLAIDGAFRAPGQLRVESWGSEGNWAADVRSCEQRHAETQEMRALLDREALWGPLRGLDDPEPLLQALEMGRVLALSDMVLLRRWLYGLQDWAEIPREEVPGTLFRAAVGNLVDPVYAVRLLDRILTPSGELSEQASPLLGSLSAEIR